MPYKTLYNGKKHKNVFPKFKRNRYLFIFFGKNIANSSS